jgi:hypothetical protein
MKHKIKCIALWSESIGGYVRAISSYGRHGDFLSRGNARADLRDEIKKHPFTRHHQIVECILTVDIPKKKVKQ